MLSTFSNGKINKDIPDPNQFNHLIVFIPKQEGIDQELILDTSTRLTVLGNLPYPDQNRDLLIVQDDGSGFFIKSPLIPAKQNQIIENFYIEVDEIGRGKIQFEEQFTGVFSEAIRTQIVHKNRSEVIGYFHSLHKKAFSNLKADEINISGIEKPSGNIKLNLETTSKSISEVYFDGKLILNLKADDLKSFFEFPKNSRYEYRKNYLFSYNKKLEYRFPKDYEIEEHNLRDITLENKYVFLS